MRVDATILAINSGGDAARLWFAGRGRGPGTGSRSSPNPAQDRRGRNRRHERVDACRSRRSTCWRTANSNVGQHDRADRGQAATRTDCLVISVTFPSSNVHSALDKSCRLKQALIEACSEIIWHVRPRARLHDAVGLFRIHGFARRSKDMDGWLNACTRRTERREGRRGRGGARAECPSSSSIAFSIERATGVGSKIAPSLFETTKDRATGSASSWISMPHGCGTGPAEDRLPATRRRGDGSRPLGRRHTDRCPGLVTGTSIFSGSRDTKPDRSLFFGKSILKTAPVSGPSWRAWRAGRSPRSHLPFRVADGATSGRGARRTFYDSDGNPSGRVGTLQDIAGGKKSRSRRRGPDTRRAGRCSRSRAVPPRLEEAAARAGATASRPRFC